MNRLSPVVGVWVVAAFTACHGLIGIGDEADTGLGADGGGDAADGGGHDAGPSVSDGGSNDGGPSGDGGSFDAGGIADAGPFIENLNVQVVANDGTWAGAIQPFSANPVFGGNRVTLVYMDNADPNNKIIAKQYDYASGAWSTQTVAIMDSHVGNIGHNAPWIYRDAAGYLEVFYGSNFCGFKADGVTVDNGPCYKRSLQPDDISAFGPEQRVTGQGPESRGGGYLNGYLHMRGEGAGGQMSYFRRDPSGIWVGGTLVNNYAGNHDGAAVYGELAIAEGALHLSWSSYLPPFNGSSEGIYYARSTDNGETWTNIDGTASFTRTGGLAAVSKYVYPSAYLVRPGVVSVQQHVTQLPTGEVVVAAGYPDTRLWRYRDGGWGTEQVSASAAVGLTLFVRANGELVIHQSSIVDSNLREYRQTGADGGWVPTLLFQRGAEQNNKLMTGALVAPPGQRERALLLWLQSYSMPSRTEVAFLDRPL